ncbi:MAG TPA: phytoene/squalene synthase family protein [Candidatus Sulfotelmatobacter sp.]
MSAGADPASAVAWTAAAPQLVMAYSVCRGITRTAAKNFYYAFLLLPRRKRESLCAVYAFMRRCDDITDDPALTLPERRRKLDLWLNSLHRAQQNCPTDDPILLALTDTQRRYQISAGLLDELAQGTAMDIQEAPLDEAEDEPLFALRPSLIRYGTFEDLRLYCYRVASVVGRVCIHIFGYRDPQAEDLAERCGLAFQLTNIIRDVKEDAQLGRIYLPEEDLVKFGLSPDDLLGTPSLAHFRPLLSYEADRAREYYRSGDELIPFIAEDSRPALWVLINIYRRLLEKIAERQYDVFTSRISLTVPEKLRILAKGLWQRV